MVRSTRMVGRARAGGMLLAGLLALGACGGTTVVEAGAPVPVGDPTPGAGGGSDDSTGAPGQGVAIGEPNPTDPEAPVSSGPLDPAPVDEQPKPEVVKPRPGMANVHTIGWDRAEVLGPKKVRIHFYGGVAPCHVLDSVRVAYRAKAVNVTLRSGSDPAKPDRMCIEIAKLMAVDVVLSEALGGRRLVDPTDAPGATDGGGSGGAAGGGTDGQAPAAKRAPTPDDGARVVTARPGTADPHPQSFDKATATGPRTVRIYFTSGVEPCAVLDSVRVAYEADRVAVTMASGRDPGVPADTACVALAEYKAVDVTLTEDLGGREIVDRTAA